MLDYIDLFAGSGGWDLAAQRLGLIGTGIELDYAACATREAVGFDTIQADVRDRMGEHGWPAGLIASPPCQSFSSAGNGSGRRDMAAVLGSLGTWSWEGMFADPRTALVLEPLRWIMYRARAGRPFEWIAMEQVPTCLPIWEGYASILESIGYFTSVGVLNSEQFGVPQTRRRAVLIAHHEKPVWLPAPTHSRYYSREPGRLDPGVLKWVSMAEALGWTDDVEVVSNYGTGGDPANRGRRTGDQPAATVTAKVNRNAIHLRSNYSAGSSHTGTAAERGRAYRPATEAPAFGITGRGGETWVLSTGANQHLVGPGRRDVPWREVCKPYERSIEAPAPTLDVKVGGAWKIHAPGERPGRGEGSTRLTAREAGVLQSFPRDFPWQGTSTEQYQQIGNAIPPLLAEALLREVASVSLDA